jgi:uracil-DNA glycosylase family 4
MTNMDSTEKTKYFDHLLSSVNECDICDRMCARKKVLSKENGNLDSKVVFIAEAPGRLGAECTGIPLYGDKTGENFDMLIGNIGWKREDIFITNAVLCNPQNENGNNSTPTKIEIENCSNYLEMVLELVAPEVIVTLGATALEALKHIHHHSFVLKNCVAQKVLWNDMALFPLYHMGPRATIHRNLLKQRQDFIELSHIVDPLKGIKKQSKKTYSSAQNNSKSSSILVDIVVEILRELETVSLFKLTKLLYLIDFNHYTEYGQSISGSVYLRMQEGPWIPSLKNITKEYEGKMLKTTFQKRKPYISFIESDHTSALSDGQKAYIKKIVLQYANSSDATMKIAAYKTAPMEYILSQEKAGRYMLRIPVLYKDASVVDLDKTDN